MIWWLLWGENINDKASEAGGDGARSRAVWEQLAANTSCVALLGFAVWPLLGLFSPLFLEEQLCSEVRGARNRRAVLPGQRLGATLAD